MLEAPALLDRAPALVRRFIYRVVAGRGVLGRLADVARFRFREDEVPTVPQVSDAAIRLVIGPANTSGQGYEWARAAERVLPGVAALAMHGVVPDPYQPKVDVDVPMAIYQRSASWHARFEAYLADQTHVIWESGLPLLGRRYGSDVLREMAWLAGQGVRGALLFHGSDIRPPSRHAAQSPWSPFRDPKRRAPSLEDDAAKNAELVAKAGVSVFVSTPDLLQWVAGAIWCPVVVDSARWRVSTPVSRTDGPAVVAHAPSHQWMKGTDRIEPMLRRLDDEGVIEYRRIVGVPHASMPAFYEDADIVLDQFLLGSYGVAACEAMAAGRLVMGHVDEPTRALVREQTGLELPILEATVESLEAELRQLVADPAAFKALGAAGLAFVDAVHDGRHSAAVMAPFLGLSA